MSCILPDAQQLYAIPGYTLVCEAKDRKDAENALPVLGKCFVSEDKELGIFRVVCQERKYIIVTTGR